MNTRRSSIAEKQVRELQRARCCLCSDPYSQQINAELARQRLHLERLKELIVSEECKAHPNWEFVKNMRAELKDVSRRMRELRGEVSAYWDEVHRIEKEIEKIQAQA